MRTIDADALMKVVKQHHDFFSGAMMDSDKARRDELHQVMADIVNAPTIDAIPVEWLRETRKDSRLTLDDVETIDLILAWWQHKREAQDGGHNRD